MATLDALQTHPTEAFATYSADGSCLAVVEKTGVRVLNAATGAEAFAMPRPQVQALSLSPRATFLLTWERMQEGDEATRGRRIGTLVVRFAERAVEWKARPAFRPWGTWDDGHVVIDGRWCEPLSRETVERIAAALLEAKRAAREPTA